MKIKSIYILLLTAAMMAGCSIKKGIQNSEITNPPSEIPSWHTCLIQGSRVRVLRGDETLTSTVTLQTVRDSMLVISVTPIMGMEMLRLEATPQTLVGIDKLNGQYAETTFTELNRKLRPELSWKQLQQICTAELPTGDRSARLLYAFEDETIEIVLDYGERKLDVPVRVTKQRTDRYTKIDITKWL